MSIKVSVHFDDFLDKRPEAICSPDERAAYRLFEILEEHGLGLPESSVMTLATRLAAGALPEGAGWYDVERLVTGDYTLCDGYCQSD